MIYISDLDGTLLGKNASLSPFAIQQLTKMIGKGMDFTIATARSIVSVQPLLASVPVQLPVICANGAYLANLQTGIRTDMQLLQGELSQDMMRLVRHHGMHVFAVSHQSDQKRERVYLEKSDNPLMRWHFNEDRRKSDERLETIEAVEAVLDQDLLNINVMAPLAQLQAFRSAMDEQFGEQVMGYLYEAEQVDGWCWMSVFHGEATKGKAIQRLLRRLTRPSEDVTVFGDQFNDISMFGVAQTAIAMGNAHPHLKQMASRIIGSNEEDSVIRYLMEISQQESEKLA